MPDKREHWSLYILRCADGTLYTGITNDLARRVAQHNRGQGAKYTRGRVPVVLAYRETCASRSEALKREYRIKQLTLPEKKRLIVEYRASERSGVPLGHWE